MTIQLPLPIKPWPIAPVSITGKLVRLEPLTAFHAPNLLAAGTPETFSWLSIGVDPWNLDGFQTYIRTLNSDPNRIPFAVIHLPTNKVIGSTSYLNIRKNDHAAEVGTTWYSPDHRGTAVNPEAKFLLFRHAFETLKAQRVFLRVDARNARSLAAVRKLGITQEGILRRDSISRMGVCRDMVIFGIIPEEWPAIRTRLINRLGYTP